MRLLTAIVIYMLRVRHIYTLCEKCRDNDYMSELEKHFCQDKKQIDAYLVNFPLSTIADALSARI